MSEYRQALEEIARLLLEEPDYDYDPRSNGPGVALQALGWVYWDCSSRFTACSGQAVGPEHELRAAGWVTRDGKPRCVRHALTTDLTHWPDGWRSGMRDVA